jgi:hypothetical protein
MNEAAANLTQGLFFAWVTLMHYWAFSHTKKYGDILNLVVFIAFCISAAASIVYIINFFFIALTV